MFVSFFSQFTRLTDGRMDRQMDISLIAKSALQRCSAVKRERKQLLCSDQTD